MTALITVAYHTGLRVGSILAARGRDLDLEAGTLTINRTKNGDPITAALSSAAIAEVKRLPKVGPDELVFGNRARKEYSYAPLWRRVAKEARLDGRVFHELRHGHGYLLVGKARRPGEAPAPRRRAEAACRRPGGDYERAATWLSVTSTRTTTIATTTNRSAWSRSSGAVLRRLG